MTRPTVRVVTVAPTAGVATDLQPGDRFDFGALDPGQAIRCDRVEPHGDLLRVFGRIIEGSDSGYSGSWVVQPDQAVEYVRGAS